MVSKRWTWLAGLAVLFAGLTNAHSHVHYCFDGQSETAAHPVDLLTHAHEIPAPHGHDSSHDDHHGARAEHHDDSAGSHEDLDVDVPNDALAKSVKHDLPGITTAVVWAADLLPSPAMDRIVDPDIPAAPDPRYARPPLRGPPL